MPLTVLDPKLFMSWDSCASLLVDQVRSIIIEAAWLIVYFAQFLVVPCNVLKRTTWLWL